MYEVASDLFNVIADNYSKDLPPGYWVNIASISNVVVVHLLELDGEEKKLTNLNPNKFEDECNKEPELVIIVRFTNGLWIDHYPINVAAEKFIHIIEDEFSNMGS